MATTGMRARFIIVGAPRSGTMALRSYLSTHPQIAMSRSHETCFFCERSPTEWTEEERNRRAWEFGHASERHAVLGESSPLALFSQAAASRIQAECSEARIIIMLRNYTDYLRSAYHYWRYLGWEDAETFEEAWWLQSLRRDGMAVPPRCAVPLVLQYGWIAQLGRHVAAFRRTFSPDHVHFVFHEDFVTRTCQAYQDVLCFLGLPSDGRTHFPRINPSRIPRHPALSRWLAEPISPRFLWPLITRARELGGIGSGTRHRILRSLARAEPAPSLPAALASEIKDSLRSDCQLLSELTGRDLLHWVQTLSATDISP